GRGVAVEGCLAVAAVTGPEAGADDLVRVGLAGDRVGAFARRSGAAGEARDREIEAAPEEMYGADFSNEARGELLEDLVGLDEDAPEAVRGVGVVGGVLGVLCEGDGV